MNIYMKTVFYFLVFIFFNSTLYAQQWLIVDIVGQNSKELTVLIDSGDEKIKRKKIKNPSIVSLINEYQNEGYTLEKVTQGVELDLNGNFPINNTRQGNNFGFTNLTLSNHNRVMLWFKKP